MFERNPGVRKAREYHARAEASMSSHELRWFFHLRMAGGTVALASVLLLAGLYVYAPVRARASDVERPPHASRRLGWLEAAPGWPDFSLPRWLPATVALAAVAFVVATVCAPVRVHRAMWAPSVTSLLLPAAFLGTVTGLVYLGSPTWPRWQLVFAAVPLVLAAAVWAVHLVAAGRSPRTGVRRPDAQ